MKTHENWSPMKSSRDRTLLFMTCVTGLIISKSLHVKASPTWDTQNSITDFGRNIRQLPCVSRRTGETGTCMFAYSCAKVNGTHLGTCIDRFYFGSCCKTPNNVEVEVNEPDNYLTNYDNNDVASATGTTGIKFGPNSSTDRIQASSSAPSSSSSYKPTSQFSVHPPSSSSTTSTSTSRNQYTQQPSSTDGPTKPAYSFGGTTANSVVPAYSSTQTAKPLLSSTSAKPSAPAAKPTSSFRPPIRDQAAATTTAQKPKPQTPKPAVQFTVPGSTVGTTGYQTASSTAAVTQEGLKPTSTYTAVTSMRPLNATTVTATFSTTKPVVKPSSSSVPPSTTYKSTTAPASTTVSTSPPPPQKAKPQTAKPVTGKPKPTSAAKPSTEPSAAPYSESTTNGIRATVETVTRPSTVAAAVGSSSSATGRPDQTISYGPTTVTSTSPTLVTWTTLDKVPVIPPEHTKPSTASPIPSMTHKPTVLDGSTLPSWVKLPVETHEPNTVPTMPVKDSSTSSSASSSTSVSYNLGSSSTTSSSSGTSSGIGTSSSSSTNSISSSTATSPTTLASKPSTAQSVSDNELIVTSGGINNNNYSSTTNPSTTVGSSSTSSASPVPSTVSVDPTDSNEAGSAPLNMSNYKDVCGRRLFPTARIVGGEKVSFGKWPWQISLRQWRTSTYLHKCGAALFNENWAVTAAHCVENVPPSDLLLRLGEHDLSIEEEPYGYEERRIQIVASHPQFDPRTFEYDLALLRFYEPVKFQPNIVPVCVPDDDANFVGTSAYVTGWGRLYEDGPLPSVLQEVTVPVINNSVCETMYRAAGYIEHIPDIFICAGWKKGGFDSCEGDSGGPMVIQRPDKRWLLAGIISWGIGCAEPNQPGVYTRISKFKDWINQILQF